MPGKRPGPARGRRARRARITEDFSYARPRTRRNPTGRDRYRLPGSRNPFMFMGDLKRKRRARPPKRKRTGSLRGAHTGAVEYHVGRTGRGGHFHQRGETMKGRRHTGISITSSGKGNVRVRGFDHTHPRRKRKRRNIKQRLGGLN